MKDVQRTGSFWEVVEALDIYSQLGLRVTVNTCLTGLNLGEILELRGLVARYPVRMHTLAFPEWSGKIYRFPEDVLDYAKD